MATLSFVANGVLSALGGVISYHIIQDYIPVFINKHMCGKDLCKVDSDPVPEPIGVISAAVYLIIMFIFIPFPLYEWSLIESTVPYDKFLMFLSALTAICSAVLLGFADDVLDLRWRHKILLPTLSSLPLLLVHHACELSTVVVIPSLIRAVIPIKEHIDIGILYYIYMGMMVVFCTNAINILAGINGLEAGQAFVIASSVVIFNVVELFLLVTTDVWYHSLSLYFLMPFLTTTSVLLYFNWYPARVFVGDTFCYWAGMTLASTCIVGRFSKTMALFLIPQVFNFIYSTPQLFGLIPCPRHRLPKFDKGTNTVNMSIVEFKEKDIKTLGRVIINVLDKFGLLHRKTFDKGGERWIAINNLTLINLLLKKAGPMHEMKLTITLLLLQISCSLFAFFIRFYVASLVFDVVR